MRTTRWTFFGTLMAAGLAGGLAASLAPRGGGEERWILLVAGGLIGSFVAGLLVRRPAADLIRTGRLQLVDDDGRVRMELGDFGKATAMPGLQLYDADGRCIARLWASGSSPALELTDGRRRINASESAVSCWDEQGRRRLIVHMDGEGAASVDIYDKDGGKRFGAA